MPEPTKDAPPDFSEGIDLDHLPDGGLLAGTVGDEPVLLTRFGEDVRAFSGKCTHLGAPLAEGLVIDGAVRCPWHHACFDLRNGAATAAPAFDPLPRWTVERSGARIRVTGAAPTQPSGDEPAGKTPRVIIVGGGAAGYAAAVALRRKGFRGAVTLLSDDAHAPYDRTLLTKDYLDGKFGDDRLPIATTSLAELEVDLRLNTPVQALDRAGKAVVLRDGSRLPYDKLLLATGAEPQRLDVPGADLPHVGVLRTVADCQGLLRRLEFAKAVVVVGSSFIGLEAAASIRSRGLDVTVVTPEDAPMAKKIGSDLSRAIVDKHRREGVAFRFGAEVAEITPDAVVLADGTRLPADAVVVGIGVKPRVALAEAAGLAVDNGVVVDATLRTSDPDIFAAGDIAAWLDPRGGRRIRVEHWVVAERQGETAAANIAGAEQTFTDVPFFWSKHFDFSFRYMGHAAAWDAVRVDGDLAAGQAVIHFVAQGRDLAVATVGQDLLALEIERRMEQDVAAGRSASPV